MTLQETSESESQQSHRQSVVVLTKDLFFVPSIRAVASDLGIEVQTVSKLGENEVQSLRTQTQSKGTILAAIVDLSAISLADLASIYGDLRALSPSGVLSAFGSHVHAIRLEKAREAGFDPVLSKGQFANSLPRLFSAWTRN